MTAIRAVIVDDEPLARRGIRQLLAAHGDIELAGEARNGKHAIELIDALAPDLVFLDIQMPEMDGFSVLRRVSVARLPAVIFVTAHDEHALQAFEHCAIDYLLKPISAERFHRSVSRARMQIHAGEEESASRQILRLLGEGISIESSLQAIARKSRPLAIGVAGDSLIFDPAEIDWIAADDYYVWVHAGGRRHLARESLSSLEARLDAEIFLRVHRSAIVNIHAIRCVQSPAGGDPVILLRDGTRVPLGRRRKRYVLEALARRVG